MAHSMKLKVIAEGVETVSQLNFLRERGCDEMQGFYFSRPLPAADRTALLTLRLAARACLLAAMVLRSVPGSPSGTLYPAASPANGCASGWLRSAQDPIMPLRQPGWRPCIPRPGG